MVTNIEWAPQTTSPVNKGDVYFVPASDVVPTQNAKGFVPQALVRDVKSLDPGSYLLFDEPFAHLANDRGVQAHFNQDSDMAKGRRGRQGVTFGQLVIRSDREPFAMETVAIKPFDQAAVAAHEAGAMTVANSFDPRRSWPLSFVPLGFYKYANGQIGLITRFDGPVLTQDLLFWDPDRIPTQEELYRALEIGAWTLGVMHRHRMAHLDPQAKNVARDNRGIRLVDLVDARRLKPGDSREHVSADVGIYLGSLTRPDEETGQVIPERDYSPGITDVFVPNYLRVAQGNGTALPKEAHLTAEDIKRLAT
jgi:hypothetical protein